MKKIDKHYPYKTEMLYDDIWWTVSSNTEDNMIVGDGIPGDKKTADYVTRHCNIIYRDVVHDCKNVLKANGVDADEILNTLLGELEEN